MTFFVKRMRNFTILTAGIMFGIFSFTMTGSVFAMEQGYPVSGSVVLTDMSPVRGAFVELSPGGYADSTDTSGHFSIAPVPAGEYILHVSMPLKGLEDFYSRVSIPLAKQEPLEIVMKPRSYRVDEVVVLSDRKDKAEKAEDLPSFVTVVERSEFENNAATVADVITAAPGANISIMGGLGDYSEVSLRGSYSNQVQVYIDGMLLNEAIGGAVNLGTIPLTNVESVEVWRSGAPARYGGDDAGGVVNIRTRGIHSARNTFSLGYGSFNSLTAGTVLNIPAGLSRFLITMDYASSDNDFEYWSDNGTMYNKKDDYRALRNNDEYRSSNLLGKYHRVFGNGMLLEVSDHVLSNKKNLPGQDYKRYSYATFETAKNLFQGKVTVNPLLSDVLEVQPTFYHIYNHECYKDIDGTVGWGIQDNIYRSNTYNFLIPLTFKFHKFATFNITSSAQHESFKPEFRLQETAPLSSDREQLGISGDALLKTSHERLTLTANIRRNRYFSSYAGQPSGFNRETPKSRFHHLTNTRCGVKVRVVKDIYLQGNYGDITRVPSLYELFGDRGWTLSNPDLKPEKIYRWDAGFRSGLLKAGWLIDGTLECAYFENRFRNLIQWYATDVGIISPENVGGSYVKGKEIIWNGTMLRRFTCKGNWTFQESKVTREMRKYYRNKQLPNRPKDYGTIKVEYPVKNVSLFWMLDHKSSYYLDRANQEHKRYPGRSLHDFGIVVSFMNGKTVLTLQGKNITDVHTFDIQGMPKPGRSYMLTVRYTLY